MEGLARYLILKKMTTCALHSWRDGVRSADGQMPTDTTGVISVSLTISCSNDASVEFFEHGYDAKGEDTSVGEQDISCQVSVGFDIIISSNRRRQSLGQDQCWVRPFR
jgi:hypothetical protein